MAESGGNLAATLGDGGASLYRSRTTGRTQPHEIIPLERSPGLPVKVIDGGRWLVGLDGEGCITWHDNRTGKLLAVYRLYPGAWSLERLDISGSEIIRGRIIRK
jgi:hypothetical protein